MGGPRQDVHFVFLACPTKPTMGSKSFPVVQFCVGAVMQDLANDIVHTDNLVEEVRMTIANKMNDDGVLLFNMWKQGGLPQLPWPKLTNSGDMGWQGRSSGGKHESLSGNATFVGFKMQKRVAWHVLAKKRSFCSGHEQSQEWKNNQQQEQEDMPDHPCRKNWDDAVCLVLWSLLQS